jgi:acyl-CoA synthetase (AMP-forming)/AMP-acid ligase II
VVEPLTIEALLARLAAYADRPCLVTAQGSVSYRDLLDARTRLASELEPDAVAGKVIGLQADYGLDSVALALALWSSRAIVALIPRDVPDFDQYVDAAGIDTVFADDGAGRLVSRRLGRQIDHPLLDRLRREEQPGMILFSSGSSGRPKAALHDLSKFLAKYSAPGKPFVTLGFLLFDHVAGQDTLLYTLNAGGTLVVPQRRQPDAVCELIEKHRVEVLPASPTFLSLLMVSGCADEFDLSSVKIITYGSEPMSPATLTRLVEAFPETRLVQKYGTTEFGAVRSLSQANDSLFIEVKQDEVETQIRDSILWVKAKGAMLGYLNAPSPIDDDGWLCTGDLVEARDGWIRILGRKSDLINVGGEKVSPAEVEAVLNELDCVVDSVVRGEPNSLLGTVVVASVTAKPGFTEADVLARARRHCRERLARHKVPMKISVTSEANVSDRQKKLRATRPS